MGQIRVRDHILAVMNMLFVLLFTLMLALTKTTDTKEIQRMFYTY